MLNNKAKQRTEKQEVVLLKHVNSLKTPFFFRRQYTEHSFCMTGINYGYYQVTTDNNLKNIQTYFTLQEKYNYDTRKQSSYNLSFSL